MTVQWPNYIVKCTSLMYQARTELSNLMLQCSRSNRIALTDHFFIN